MINITKHLKISVLTVIMFAAGIILHYPVMFYITYGVMILHECAHLAAALCIGLTPDYLVMQPFGLNLRLKNKIVSSMADEVILYLSGPLLNAAMAVAAAVAYRSIPFDEVRLFYISNIMLFVMNILPAAPLDGGELIKRFVARKKGIKTALSAGKIMTVTLAALLMALGLYVISKNKYNYSLIIFAVLLFGNIFTQKEKYDVDFLGELMFYKKKNKPRVHHIIADSKEDDVHIAEKFKPDSYNIVYIVNESGDILNTVTETRFIEELTKRERQYSSSVTNQGTVIRPL